jgi:hypothetical protein
LKVRIAMMGGRRGAVMVMTIFGAWREGVEVVQEQRQQQQQQQHGRLKLQVNVRNPNS